MTRKHFEAIAAALHAAKPLDRCGLQYGERYKTWSEVVKSVTLALYRFNPNFDSGRFIAACEVGVK